MAVVEANANSLWVLTGAIAARMISQTRPMS